MPCFHFPLVKVKERAGHVWWMVLVGELAEYHKSDKVHLQVHCIRMTSLFYG